MTSAIEKAARARYGAWRTRLESRTGVSFFGWDDLPAEERSGMIADERTALETLLPPSDEVVEAACNAYSPSPITTSARENMRAALYTAVMKAIGR